jgi:hypothetical protein
MRDAGDYHRRGGHLAEDTDDRTWEMEGIAMNESDKKLIMEKLLGEPYEAWIDAAGTLFPAEGNRPFTDPQDFFACFNRLVELGKWIPFENMAFVEWDVTTRSPYQQFTEWLLSRTESGHYRLCVLCAEWLKEDKDGHQ